MTVLTVLMVLALALAGALVADYAWERAKPSWRRRHLVYLGGLVLVATGTMLTFVDAVAAGGARIAAGIAVLATGVALFVVGELRDHRPDHRRE